MIKNYFKTAFRNLLRNKTYAAINITGLAVGIAACLLIFLVIQYETSFDTFHKKKDNIYRVVSEFKSPDGTHHSSGVPFPVAEALRIDFPQLKKVAAIFESNRLITIPQEDKNQPAKKFKGAGVFFAEPEFFEMFDFEWMGGDAKQTLTAPNNAALTRETAERYFGDWKNAVGKSIRFDNRYTSECSYEYRFSIEYGGILFNVEKHERCQESERLGKYFQPGILFCGIA